MIAGHRLLDTCCLLLVALPVSLLVWHPRVSANRLDQTVNTRKSHKVPLAPGHENGANGRVLPDFAFAKHSPEIIDRIVTQIAGATFVTRVVNQGRGGGNKRGAGSGAASSSNAPDGADGAGECAERVVDVTELLQPKKKARKGAAKRKAAAKPKSGAKPPAQTADDLLADIAIGDGDGDGEDEHRPTRSRVWLDDLIGCLSHAAGGILSKQHDGTTVDDVNATWLSSVSNHIQLPEA